ncbi:hypothetical protein FRB94_002988 [Tulasnella sp. JGI-2019a]|nr:hypothetical protein FRB94_002988 [Tulasnella sp. JGI-2019a]
MSTGAPPQSSLRVPPSPAQGSQTSFDPDSPLPQHRKIPRVSFGSRSYHQTNRPVPAESNQGSEEDGKPPIPSALPQQGSTPLPIIPMTVLSIAILGEFLSANVCTPFLLFMVEGFGIPPDDVGYKTGLLVSMFFITQFLTAILWAAFADKYGCRAVLGISLLGNALTCLAFGTATTYYEAVAIRLLQGVFNGSLGVARGAVTNITDGTNEATAYSIIGFCWGFGGVAGAIVGGAFESPVNKWPNGIGSLPIFVEYPYLLPCGISASITFTGAVLSLFLGWDGGPREGLIRLQTDEEGGTSTLPVVAELAETPNSGSDKLDLATTPGDNNIMERVAERTKLVQKKLSGYFARRVRDAHYQESIPPSVNGTPSGGAGGRAISAPNTGLTIARTLPHGSPQTMRSRLASTLGGRSGASTRQRRRLMGQGGGEDDVGDLNLAQRLLLANPGSVTSMANLWVAAAINADNEDPFLEDTPAYTARDLPNTPGRNPDELDSVFGLDEEEFTPATPAMGGNNRTLGGRGGGSGRVDAISPRQPLADLTQSAISANRPNRAFLLPSTGFSPINRISPRRSLKEFTTPLVQPGSLGREYVIGSRGPTRRGSISSNLVTLPTIFQNTGLATLPALAQQSPASTYLVDAEADDDDRVMRRHNQYLSAITEGTAMTDLPSPATYGNVNTSTHTLVKPEPSPWGQLPIIIIFQYGILALHNEVHDQYFLTYLVSPYEMGGLGLNAGHFAQLIALMCLVQVFYQFYLYPNVGYVA